MQIERPADNRRFVPASLLGRGLQRVGEALMRRLIRIAQQEDAVHVPGVWLVRIRVGSDHLAELGPGQDDRRGAYAEGGGYGGLEFGGQRSRVVMGRREDDIAGL